MKEDAKTNYFNFLEKNCSGCTGKKIGGNECIYTKSNPLENLTSVLSGEVDSCSEKIIEGERIYVNMKNCKNIIRYKYSGKSSYFYVVPLNTEKAKLFIHEEKLDKMLPGPENDTVIAWFFNLKHLCDEPKKEYEFVEPAIVSFDGKEGQLKEKGKIIVHK